MLGKRIVDGVESGVEQMDGLGLLDVETQFAPDKVTTRVNGHCLAALPGMLASAAEHPLEGYEIHMGVSHLGADATFARLTLRNGQAEQWVDGAVNADGNVLGSYIHGLFDSHDFTRALLDNLRQRKGLAVFDGVTVDYAQHKQQQFDLLAAQMRQHIDIERIYQLMTAHQQESAQ